MKHPMIGLSGVLSVKCCQLSSSHLMIHLIISCATSTHVSVLFNRGALKLLNPWGIRQVSIIPLALSYFFILCMEYLGNYKSGWLLLLARSWDPVKGSRGRSPNNLNHSFSPIDDQLYGCICLLRLMKRIAEL